MNINRDTLYRDIVEEPASHSFGLENHLRQQVRLSLTFMMPPEDCSFLECDVLVAWDSPAPGCRVGGMGQPYSWSLLTWLLCTFLQDSSWEPEQESLGGFTKVAFDLLVNH